MAERTGLGRSVRRQGRTGARRRTGKRRGGMVHRLWPRLLQLEDRTLLSLGTAGDAAQSPLRIGPVASRDVAPLQVVLINQDVPEARQIAATASPGVITLMYDPLTTDTAGLVRMLDDVSSDRGGAPIDHLALVTHGHSGQVDVAAGDAWSL